MEPRVEAIYYDIKNIIIRCNDLIDGYYREYYIYPEKEILRDIYQNLQRAFVSIGKLKGSHLVKDTIFDVFNLEDESEILKSYIQNVVGIILNNYNIEIANSTSDILWKINSDCVEYTDSYTIAKLIKKISFVTYLVSHEEYEKVKELFEIEQRCRSYGSSNYNFSELLEFRAIFEEFYNKFSVVSTIKDKYFRSVICAYFKNFVKPDIL